MALRRKDTPGSKNARGASAKTCAAAPRADSSPEAELPPRALKLLRHIKEICLNSKDRSCFKSIKNIAADCGLALQTAHKYKHLLHTRGLIRIEERANGKRKNPRHRITLRGGKIEPRQSTSTSYLCWSVRVDAGAPLSGQAPVGRVKLSGLSLWRELDRLDLIYQYLLSGWQVCPAHHPVFENENVTACSCRAGRRCVKIGKHPKFSRRKWSSLFRGKNYKLIDHFFNNPADNVGVWLPNGLMVVDIDDVQAGEEVFGYTTPETLTCSTARGYHLYFLAHELFKTTASRVKANIDVRAPGSWLILPPSVHKTGATYEWENLVIPTTVPSALVQLLANSVTGQVAGEQPAKGDKVVRVRSFVLPEVIYKPNTKHLCPSDECFGVGRNSHLFAYGRSLRARGKDYRAICVALQRANNEKCVPPISPAEMKRLVENVWALPDKPDWRSAIST